MKVRGVQNYSNQNGINKINAKKNNTTFGHVLYSKKYNNFIRTKFADNPKVIQAFEDLPKHKLNIREIFGNETQNNPDKKFLLDKFCSYFPPSWLEDFPIVIHSIDDKINENYAHIIYDYDTFIPDIQKNTYRQQGLMVPINFDKNSSEYIENTMVVPNIDMVKNSLKSLIECTFFEPQERRTDRWLGNDLVEYRRDGKFWEED